MRPGHVLRVLAAVGLVLGLAGRVAAQTAAVTTRQATIEQEQASKDRHLEPYVPDKAEHDIERFEALLNGGTPRWHPFLESAYSGGGFAFGAGYLQHVSAYNFVDVRGSYTLSGYRRAEVEFQAPHLLQRRATLSVLGGWREATEVGFYGLGTDQTSKDDRTNYDFEQPYGSATFTVWPTRRLLLLRGGVEWSRWSQEPGQGAFPSVETRFTPDSLPGLGATTTYLHTQATAGFDWRTSAGYARRGGYYGITAHDFSDRDDALGFEQVDYEAIQHIPILREAWVLSLRGRVQTAFNKSNQEIPFFMLPALGGGSTLRGFSSWRFRDRDSLLMQAEWRIMDNRFLDTAVFMDAGKVTPRPSDLDLKNLKSDYGIGVRFHGPFATPLRVEVARSNEGLALVLSASPVF
jgi:hypothetical protein